ncbi:MAG: hypothetical protein JWL68_1302 [Actinomycetia bacterium]|nr:hypothetical protein [Actinomycetes bacterium]MDX6336251.1 hypothetical protein [Streptosporangiaceae bacterium]
MALWGRGQVALDGLLADVRAGRSRARVEQSFLRRITPLPGVTQRLLLLAAAERDGNYRGRTPR